MKNKKSLENEYNKYLNIENNKRNKIEFDKGFES